MGRPYVSVIMPTYNRAKLIPFAVRSVLEQTFDDLELIISNGGSTDETRKVVSEFSDKRIKYIESEKRLNIGDNYQQGYDNAQGEFITFLSDDDALTPTAVEQVLNIIKERAAQMVVFRSCFYSEDNDSEGEKNESFLTIQPFTEEISEFSAKRGVENLCRQYGLQHYEPPGQTIVPYLANAVYHYTIFDKVSRMNPKMFALTPADMYLAAAVFFVVDSYFCLDKPLHLWREWIGTSTASSEKKGRELREHYEKLLNGETNKINTYPGFENLC